MAYNGGRVTQQNIECRPREATTPRAQNTGPFDSVGHYSAEDKTSNDNGLLGWLDLVVLSRTS